MTGSRYRVLLVCLGNICRSPTAEAVLRQRLQVAGLGARVVVDSAGTGAWHSGQPPHSRSQSHALRRGYDLSAQRARQVIEADYERFDLMLAMDADNLADLQRARPASAIAELGLFAAGDVPDPYAGGAEGFERVLDIVEAAADAWVQTICRRVGTR